MTTYGQDSFYKMLRLQNQVYSQEVSQPSFSGEQSPSIKIPLRPHQKSMVDQMSLHEQKLTKGWDISGETLYSSYGVLGDGVGVGKSLMILSHIANLKKTSPLLAPPSISQPNSRFLYSTMSRQITDISQAAPILIVPHTLYRQWITYIKEQTTFKPLTLATRKQLEKNLLQQICKTDFILISNTLYPFFIQKLPPSIEFQRVFIDEADTIRIPKNKYLKSPFTWLVSASWPNLLFPNLYYTCPSVLIRDQVPNLNIHAELKQQYSSSISTNVWFQQYFRITSMSFFREMIETPHPLRGHLVLKCSREFIQQSISLPPLYRINLLCSPSITQQIVDGSITPELRSLLHAGDVQSVLQQLGVPGDTPLSLIQAVSENRVRELDRLKKTYEFKSSIEYHTPQAKELALAHLHSKIKHLEEQISTIRERIENFQKEICPICFDEPVSAVLTPCCSRIFCAACILNSLARNTACPLCREATRPSQLRRISETATNTPVQPQAPRPLKKREQLLKLLQENPTGKFLIFSRYDNPFLAIEQEVQHLNIKVRQVKGNKDAIQNTLSSFAKGEIQCLLLNSLHAGSGLTITAATHVILLHAMNIEEEKQILGRAYRLGRTTPLTMYRLLHPDEFSEN